MPERFDIRIIHEPNDGGFMPLPDDWRERHTATPAASDWRIAGHGADATPETAPSRSASLTSLHGGSASSTSSAKAPPIPGGGPRVLGISTDGTGTASFGDPTDTWAAMAGMGANPLGGSAASKPGAVAHADSHRRRRRLG